MGSTQKYIIVKDRVEIYKDFTINLLYYIVEKYYFDSETLNEDTDIKNHYNWCFNKVCNEFKMESIDFSKNTSLRNYFYEFFYHQYYKKENPNSPFPYYEKFWRNIFEIDKQKNKNIINTMIEIYNIFDKSINKEKNILEIV